MVLEWALGHTEVTFHASRNSVSLATKSGDLSDWYSLCRRAIPPCQLNGLIFNGHLQTFGVVFDRPKLPIYYKRWVFQQENTLFPGQFAVDFVVNPNEDRGDGLPENTTNFTEEEFDKLGSLDSKPMLVILHGVSGGSHESYLRHALVPFVCGNEREWEACVVNSRGCAHSNLSTGLLYNARATWDFRQTVNWLRQMFPNRPLFGVGYSMGANILIHVRSIQNAHFAISDQVLNLAVSCRRRQKLPPPSGCILLESVEFRSTAPSSPEFIRYARGVFSRSNKGIEEVSSKVCNSHFLTCYQAF